MNFIESLRNDHEAVERELTELDTIIEYSDETINYPNLLYVLKKIYSMWDEHEQKEEGVFNVFKKIEIVIPVKKMNFDHKNLKRHRKKLEKTFKSNSESRIREAIKKDLKEIITKLRVHMESEENTLWILPMEEIFSLEELNQIDSLFNNLKK